MINLYIFTESCHANVYGVGTYIRELAAALKDSDINVCVVHLRSEERDDGQTESDGIRYLYFPLPSNWKTSSDRNKQYELYYRNVVYLLRLQITDTEKLVFHLNYNQSRKLAEELITTFDCKIITTIHYLDWSLSLSGNITYFKKLLDVKEIDMSNEIKKGIVESYQKEKEYFELVEHIICLSENTQQILRDDYKIKSDKTIVIYNGLTDCNFNSDKQILRQKYHIPDIPLILFAGRLNNIKGLKYALQAFRIVLNQLPQCHFIIVGNGEFDIYMKECEDIWMQVTWTGLIDREKLFDLYSIADVGVMPSLHEQCSYVAIEMMMHGLPIISSSSKGLREIIVDGETGLHIPVIEHPDKVEIDISLFAEKMLFLLQNPEERKRLGTNARRRYKTVYSAEVFCSKMTGFYHSLYK